MSLLLVKILHGSNGRIDGKIFIRRCSGIDRGKSSAIAALAKDKACRAVGQGHGLAVLYV